MMLNIIFISNTEGPSYFGGTLSKEKRMKRSWMNLSWLLVGSVAALAACSDDETSGTGGATAASTTASSATTSTSDATSTTTGTGGGGTGGGGTGGSGVGGSGVGGSGGAPPVMVDEKKADVALTLTGQILSITVTDAGAPVRTDVWLHTTADGVNVAPFGTFVDPPNKRKHRGLMMPCTIAGQPSGLLPCETDTTAQNGLLTDGNRETLSMGVYASAIDGKVDVDLGAVPTQTIVVEVAVEDQRYFGAAAIDIAGVAAAVPAGVGVAQSYVARTFADVSPIFAAHCHECHAPGGETDYFPLVTYDDVVNFNLAYYEEKSDCEAQFPNDPAGLQTCLDAITAVEYMVEQGSPSWSPLMRRARPDENGNTSPTGLKWYGSSGNRFGSHGDRRMPPHNTTADLADDDATAPIHFDMTPSDYQLLWDWVAQGAQP